MLIRWTPLASTTLKIISRYIERQRNLATANRICRIIYDTIQILRNSSETFLLAGRSRHHTEPLQNRLKRGIKRYPFFQSGLQTSQIHFSALVAGCFTMPALEPPR